IPASSFLPNTVKSYYCLWFEDSSERALSKSFPLAGVFGQRLEETVLYERRYGVRLVPLVVEQCVTFIRERGLHEVGLFRQPGRASLVKELSSLRVPFRFICSNTDVHTVASLLKLYLRQLPEPGLTSHLDALLSFFSQGLRELRILLHELPVANFNLLNFICQFLNEVHSYSCTNKMGVQNLATVFGPNILRNTSLCLQKFLHPSTPAHLEVHMDLQVL
uniref:Rho-GAP domain-containing protein n=1 Tax=Oreochromis niloticus TaxID=8128 RepID=A0A669B562_ORENI